MEDQNKPKWYFNNWSLIVSFLCLGPLMLPLVWINPQFSRNVKIIISSVILIATGWLAIFSVKLLKGLSDYYQISI